MNCEKYNRRWKVSDSVGPMLGTYVRSMLGTYVRDLC